MNLQTDSLYRLIVALVSHGWDRDQIIAMLSNVPPHMITVRYPYAHRLVQRRATEAASETK